MRLFIYFFLLLWLLPVPAAAQTTPCVLDTFIAYIQRNDTAAVRQCLKNGTNPNAEWLGYDIIRNKENKVVSAQIMYRRPIYYAIEAKNLAMVKLLVEFGASVNKGEWAIQDTVKRYENFAGWFDAPLDLAKRDKLTAIHDFLLTKEAKGAKYQYALGERFYKLLEYCRKSPDSLLALKTLIHNHYDEIEFAGREKKAYVCYDALMYNIWPAVTYLIDQHRADFKPVWIYKPGLRIFGRGGGEVWLLYPIEGLKFEYASINLVEYLEARAIINDSIINADLVFYRVKRNKFIYDYFKLRNKRNTLQRARQTPANKRKIKRITQKMNQIKKRDMRKNPDLL
jgi:hypothetical protein